MQAARIASLFVGTLSAVLIPQGTREQPVRCQGRLKIQQTYDWDLDDGVVSQMGESFEAPYDFWYAATRTPMNTVHRYLVPGNSAAVAVAGDRAVGYQGCRSADLSDKVVDLGKLPKGSFLCARTNDGRPLARRRSR